DKSKKTKGKERVTTADRLVDKVIVDERSDYVQALHRAPTTQRKE
ncbi:2936_t:CDS:2, partial [Racocetra persica]